jgi:hypothetical protein
MVGAMNALLAGLYLTAPAAIAYVAYWAAARIVAKLFARSAR